MISGFLTVTFQQDFLPHPLHILGPRPNRIPVPSLEFDNFFSATF